jgi:crotonobetainyl-CoA:carnitine CoA-transferase CaiB-like acyl-CoA transferase
VTGDEQAGQFFVEWDHPNYGRIKVINNPIKLSKTPAEIRMRAPELGEHTDQVMKEAGYSEAEIAEMRKAGTIR